MFLETVKSLSVDGRSVSIHNLSGVELEFHFQVGITDIRLVVANKPSKVEDKPKRGRPRKYPK